MAADPLWGPKILNQKRKGNKEKVFPATHKKSGGGDFLEALQSGKPSLPVPLLFSCVALGKLLQVSEPQFPIDTVGLI